VQITHELTFESLKSIPGIATYIFKMARRTPRGPEVEQNHLAFVPKQIHRSGLRVIQTAAATIRRFHDKN
jgi:hypothetical protein